MVAPFEHVPRLQEVGPETMAEMMDLAQQAMRRIEQVYGPEGFNVGLNQGRVAGAGVEGHIHLHVVPRWAGDNNYMPVLADTRVMPQSLEDSYDVLEGGFA
jgi:ATP adenylyltransferase